MTITRIYVVMQNDKPMRLVDATSAAQAIRHCVRREYAAKAATPKDIASLMGAGTTIEAANESNDNSTNNLKDN